MARRKIIMNLHIALKGKKTEVSSRCRGEFFFSRRNGKNRHGSVVLLLAFVWALTGACGGKQGEGEKHIEYLAVQKDKDSHWSIIGRDGNVVVKEEYEPESILSQITDDGLYWVLSNGKNTLYSVDSPKRPVTSREFDAVQPFYSGCAFALETAGNQIELINKKGETVKILPKNIAKVCPFRDGLAQYKDADGKWGYLDTDGDVKIKAAYYKTFDFSEGHAIVQKDNDGDYSVITTDGKERATIKSDKYLVLSEFRDGMIGAEKKGSKELVFLDTKGNEVISLSKKISGYTDGYRKGRAIISDFGNGFKVGVVDKEGELVIRIGKYRTIAYVGSGFYAVEKDDKYGIVDGDDNEVVGFDYTGALAMMLGDCFVMHDGNEYVLVDQSGEEVRGSEFAAASMFQYTSPLNYYDIDGLAQKVADSYSTDGYLPLNRVDSPEAMAKKFGLTMEDCRWKEYFIHAIDSGEVSAVTKIHLDRFAVKTKYRTETVSDGWFEYKQQKEDGLMWNEDARVAYVETSVMLTDADMAATFAKTIIPKLKQRGFVRQANDRCFYDSENKSSMEVEESGSEVRIIFKKQ